MILFISDFGGSLPIVYRMKQEGTDVKVYVHNKIYKNSYDGILDKVEIKDLKKMMMSAEKIVFDSNVKLGSLIDGMEDKMIGMSRDLSKYESDTDDGRVLAKKVGIKTKKGVTGVQIITEMWFGGKEPVLFVHSLPNQRWLTGNLGLETGSQSNCLWAKKETGLLVDELKSLVPMLSKAGYVGPVSVDCTVNSKDKKPYFNNWRFGFRYDSIFCLLSLLDKPVTEFINGDFAIANDNLSCSERLTIAPYPYANEELLNLLARNIKLNIDLNNMNGFWAQDIKSEDDEIECAGNDGILGVMTSKGRKIEDGFGEIYKAIRKLNIEAPLQFRIDGAKESNKRFKKLNDWNVCIN